jgi:SAM-dependent methyltransferase
MPDQALVSRQKIADWYNSRYSRAQESAYRPYAAYQHFLATVKNYLVPGQRLLDIGSGQGYLLRAAIERGLKPVGLDLSLEAMRVSSKVVPAPVVNAVGETLPFASGSFDVIVCMGSLEHHLDMAAALREIVRIGAPQATVILLVPNRDFWGYAALRQKGTAQQEIKETLQSFDEWKQLFEGCGLQVMGTLTDDWFLHQPLSFGRGPAGLVRQILRKVALILAPFKRTYAFVFACCKIA